MTTDDPTPQDGENVSKESPTTNTRPTLDRATIGAVNASGWIKPDTLAGDCSVTVDATHDARGASEIEVRTVVAGGEVSVALTPDDARALAAKLRSAAAYADGGADR